MARVVLLAKELRVSEIRLIRAFRLAKTGRDAGLTKDIAVLVAASRALNRRLIETPATTPQGAGILIRLAVQRMSPLHNFHAARLSDIADRLTDGHRSHADLVALRAITANLKKDLTGEATATISQLLRNAICGAATPTVAADTYADHRRAATL